MSLALVAGKILEKPELINAFLGSALGLAIATPLITALQWNLEHLAIKRTYDGKFQIVRLSTQDAVNNINNPDLSALNFPAMSLAHYIASLGADNLDKASGFLGGVLDLISLKPVIK